MKYSLATILSIGVSARSSLPTPDKKQLEQTRTRNFSTENSCADPVTSYVSPYPCLPEADYVGMGFDVINWSTSSKSRVVQNRYSENGVSNCIYIIPIPHN